MLTAALFFERCLLSSRKLFETPLGFTQVQDVGTHAMLSADAGGTALKARLHADAPLPAVGETVWLRVLDTHTCYYRDEELVA